MASLSGPVFPLTNFRLFLFLHGSSGLPLRCSRLGGEIPIARSPGATLLRLRSASATALLRLNKQQTPVNIDLLRPEAICRPWPGGRHPALKSTISNGYHSSQPAGTYQPTAYPYQSDLCAPTSTKTLFRGSPVHRSIIPTFHPCIIPFLKCHGYTGWRGLSRVGHGLRTFQKPLILLACHDVTT